MVNFLNPQHKQNFWGKMLAMPAVPKSANKSENATSFSRHSVLGIAAQKKLMNAFCAMRQNPRWISL